MKKSKTVYDPKVGFFIVEEETKEEKPKVRPKAKKNQADTEAEVKSDED